jgi:hypothetical protein
MDWQTILSTVSVLSMPVYAVFSKHRATRKVRQAWSDQQAEQMRQLESVKKTLAPHYTTLSDSDGDDGA